MASEKKNRSNGKKCVEIQANWTLLILDTIITFFLSIKIVNIVLFLQYYFILIVLYYVQIYFRSYIRFSFLFHRYKSCL